jgi:hypothetical protein
MATNAAQMIMRTLPVQALSRAPFGFGGIGISGGNERYATAIESRGLAGEERQFLDGMTTCICS